MRESRFFVQVDIRALRRRLADHRARRTVTAGYRTNDVVTNDDAFAWLTSNGFHLGRGGWYANSTTLNRLHRTAIIKSRRVR